MVGTRFPFPAARSALFALAVAMFPAWASASAPCQQGVECGPAPLTSQLFGFFTSNTTLTFAAPGPLYDVLGDVVVNPGVTLTIQPGVTLRFAANHDTLNGGDFTNLAELRVRGTLACDASSGDSIRFVSSGTGSGEWGQIKIESTGSATFRKVSISGASNGVVLLGPGTLADVTISNADYGILAQGGPHSLFRVVMSNVTNGVLINDPSALGTIRECVIHGRFLGSGTGLMLPVGVSTAPTDSTQPVPTEVAGFQYGVSTFAGATAQNLVTRNNTFGMYLTSSAAVSYCTSVNNSTFGIYTPNGATIVVHNSVVVSNASGGVMSGYYNANSLADYTDSWSNGTNFSGVTVGVNTASFNPFFVDPAAHDYHLAANSIFKNYSNSAGEIGAFGPGTCAAVVVDPSDTGRTPSLRSSPNPTRDAAVLEFEQAVPGRATVDILDVLGRRIRRVADDFRTAGTQRVAWEGTDETGGSVPPGLYFWRVASGSGIRTGRLVVSR